MVDTSAAAWKDLAFLPCLSNSKKPQPKHGYLDATKNFNFEEAFAKGFNIGLALAPSGLIALDADCDEARGLNGLESLAKLEEKLGKLSLTYSQQTPRMGGHFVFSAKGITNPIGKIGRDIDIKYLGYILFSGSSINGRYYKTINGIDETGNPIFAELPENWLNFLNKPISTSITNSNIKSKKVIKPCHYDKIDIAKVFERCAYLRHCKDCAEILSEVEWHSMICLLAHFDGCEDLIHELSEPYYNYSFEETQKKIDYAKAFGRPQSCAYISANYPEICDNCPSAVKNRGDN